MGITAAVTTGLEALGTGAAFATSAAPIIAGVGEGALAGGTISGLTGGNIGKGALGGAITGGFIPAGGELLGGTIGSTAADALGGAVGGGLGAEVTGGNPLLGAAGGGLAGGIEGYNASGAPIDSSGNTVAAPAAPTSVTPSSGSAVGASEQPVISEKALDAMLNPTGSGATSLGNVAGGGNTGSFPLSTAASPLPDISGSSPVGVGAAGAAAPATTGGISDWLPAKSEVGSAVLKNALPLGGLAYEALKGPSALPPASKTLAPGGAATAPLLSLEQQNATEAQTGQLTPSQQASITKTVQEQQNQLIQQLASQGVTDPTHDSRYLEGMKTIQQNALALENQYIQQALTNAVSAGGAASTNIANVAQQQISNDAEFQNALASAFGAIGGFGGASAKAA